MKIRTYRKKMCDAILESYRLPEKHYFDKADKRLLEGIHGIENDDLTVREYKKKMLKEECDNLSQCLDNIEDVPF